MPFKSEHSFEPQVPRRDFRIYDYPVINQAFILSGSNAFVI